jgi:2-dehydro-3-deoxygluconokinase
MTETSGHPSVPPGAVEVLCVGETMVLLAPESGARLSDVDAAVRLHIGGAESNVAMALARLGVRSGWWSRLGDDAFGRVVAERVADAGVDVDIRTDATRPTGLYVKDVTAGGTRVTYYRRGSAASAMGPADAAALPPWTRVLHLSGITPALSADADALVEALVTAPRTDGRMVSFDVNHRPALWEHGTAAARLAELGGRADILFVGLDEASALWGVDAPRDLREIFPHVPHLVVKDGANDATALIGDEIVRVATPPADVTEVVGAGDAFAAGYLAALLRDASPTRRLMAGHLAAREAIAHTADVALLPPLDDLLARAAVHWPAAPDDTLTRTGAAR